MILRWPRSLLGSGAIVGGFHLGPAPPDYLKQVVAEIRKLEPDVLIPLHCSGLNFTLRRRHRCRVR